MSDNKMKKILIITSVTTGSGHKSICDSLIEQFELMPDVNAKAVDGFDMAGSFAYHSSYIYGMLTPATVRGFTIFSGR